MRPVHIFGILLKNMNFPSLKSHSGWHLLQRTPVLSPACYSHLNH